MIDAHLHIDHKGRNLEATIEHIESLGAEAAVLLPIETGDDEYQWLSKYVEEAKSKYHEKVIPFCHVDATREDAVEELERRVKRGVFVGYGEQKQHIPLNHKGLDKVLAFCNELSWAVTFHFQEGENGYNQGIEHLETLLKRHPNARFIGHAQSWWANVSAEVPPPEETLYPKGPIVEGGLADRLLSDYENMFADLSAGSGLGALTRDEEFAKGFLRRQGKKLMFATDCPCQDAMGEGCFAKESLPYLERMVEDEGAMADILHNNAMRIIGLE